MRRQRGVALLIALLVVALATILIAALLDRGGLTAARTRNQLRQLQAENYAKGLEDYAARVLWQDNQNADNTDASDDIWAVPLPPTPVPGGDITATMTDLDGRFNLNNLSDDNAAQQGAWQAKFGLLLQALKLDPNLAQNVRNWMSADPASGAGEAWYLAQAVPYRAGHRQFAHVSELRMVEGFDGDTYARILPHVSALPAGTTININTATVPVLMTLTEGMTEQTAAAIWQQGHAHFQGVSDLQKSPYSIGTVPAAFYGVQSQFFLARGDITLDGLPFTFYSLLQRSFGKGAGPDSGVLVLQRSRGGE
jgi:general secretion pathway protein K